VSDIEIGLGLQSMSCEWEMLPPTDVVSDTAEEDNEFNTLTSEHNYSMENCPSTLFTHKLLVPLRRECSSRKSRVSAPSYNLTGAEHMAFMNEKFDKKKKVWRRRAE